MSTSVLAAAAEFVTCGSVLGKAGRAAVVVSMFVCPDIGIAAGEEALSCGGGAKDCPTNVRLPNRTSAPSEPARVEKTGAFGALVRTGGAEAVSGADTGFVGVAEGGAGGDGGSSLVAGASSLTRLSGEIMRRMEAMISSIGGSWALAGWVMGCVLAAGNPARPIDASANQSVQPHRSMRSGARVASKHKKARGTTPIKQSAGQSIERTEQIERARVF